jgi:GntR family transcriptional regulator
MEMSANYDDGAVAPPATDERRAVPVFRAIAEQLADAIRSGQISGDLPPEQELARANGVSRVTMRRALRVVADAGLAEVTWGRGWSVRQGPLSEPANTLLSVTELAAERRLSARSRVLLAEVRPVALDEAEELEIAAGAAVFVLDRVRFNDDAVFARQLSTIRADRVPGIEAVDFSARSLYATLEQRWNVSPTRADYAVEARPADVENAAYLGVEPGSPLLWATQKTFDQHGTVIEIGWSAYPWDRYRFRATLTRRPHPGRGAALSAAPGSTPTTLDGNATKRMERDRHEDALEDRTR